MARKEIFMLPEIRYRLHIVPIFAALFAVLVPALGISAEPVWKSSLEDQKAVELTVYNNNLGLVKDIREFILPEGTGELRFMDVAASINPVSVRAVSLNAPGEFRILEQNYEYDLISPDHLLDKYVGK